MSSPISSSKSRLPSLDGLRAVSICLVVIGHATATVKSSSVGVLPVLRLLGIARLGVSIFFVISGFLITTLLLIERQQTDTINLRAFYIRRAFRICPCFYSYCLVTVVLALLGYIQLTKSDMISAATYTWNYTHRTVDTWFLGHTWSLSVEEQFYLLWPGIVTLSGLKWGPRTALAVIVVSPVTRVASYYLLPSSRPLIGMMLHTRADSLIVGSLLAYLYINQHHLIILKRYVRSTIIPLAFILFVAIDNFLTGTFGGAYSFPIGFTLENLIIALFIAHCLFYPHTLVGRILNHPLLVHIGVMSYSLYLWQQLFLTPRNTTITGTFPWNIACAVLAAELSYHLIELPFLSWRKYFLDSLTERPGERSPASKPEERQLAASV